MLSRVHRFFSLTATRQYAVDSSRHLQLQAELSEKLEQYRHINTKLTEIQIFKNHIKDDLTSVGRVQFSGLNSLHKQHVLQKETLTTHIKALLDIIKEECAMKTSLPAIQPSPKR